ncbi:MAG: sigma-54-dependent Fis family transcriptional regulator, partial [Desulfobacterales bacterium]
ILIIGKDEAATRNFDDALASDFHISASPTVADAEQRIQKETFNIIIFDLSDDDSHLAESLQELRHNAPFTPIIVTSTQHRADLIVSAIKAGAFDFITKPFAVEKLKLTVSQALENRSLKNEIDYLRRQQDVVYDYDRIIAVSPAMSEIMGTIKKLSQTDSTILVTGETGTGKSFLSGNIHFNSPRHHKPFIKVNCANIPETLLESELFGHEKGAFTGANKTRTGRFEQANGGTLFLDELCELSFALQAKLLRALEEKAFERLGGNKTIHSDTRIIAATNQDIEALVGSANFREDLYYRINVLRIHLPPLRERTECIEPLANYLLKKLSRSVKKHVEAFSPEVIKLFQNYAWPGNIREMSNTIERAILLADGSMIRKENVSLPKVNVISAPEEPSRYLRLSEDQERDLIYQALEKNLWIQKDAAKELGITPRALNYRIKKLGITHSRWRKHR